MRLALSALPAALLLASSVGAQAPTRVIDLETASSPAPTKAEPPPLSDYGLRLPWEGEPPNSPFREGSWVALIYGSGTFGIADDDVRAWGGHAAIGYYFADNMSFNIALSGYYGDRLVDRDLDIDQGSFHGGSVTGLMRCHVLNYGSWSAFADGGVGLSYLSKSVPADGTNWNFVLTAGVGITKQICEDTHWICGARWFHLSNGAFFNPGSRNPGYDGGFLYTGLLFQY